MRITRRNLLRNAALVTGLGLSRSAFDADRLLPKRLPMCRGGKLLPVALQKGETTVRPILLSSTLTPFVDPLPIPEVAKPVSGEPRGRPAHYRFVMREIEGQVHRDMKPTRFWSYGNSIPGPTIEARSGHPITVEWVNQLPKKHFLPIDPRLHGAEPGAPEVRTVVHLHGGRTPHESDGYPDDWFQPGESATFHYPNAQEATTLWYHDHAMGANRLNVYAGLFGTYLIRDDFEDHLNLPRGEFEIPLAFCDRSFFRDDHQLCYPISGHPGAPWVTDIDADGTLINGKLFPYLEVQPRKYRFRLVCAANSRTYYLALSNGQHFEQIGSDQGLLVAPVSVAQLSLAPAERADVIIDFNELAGQRVTLRAGAVDVLQFRVGQTERPDTSAVPARLRAVERISPKRIVKTRQMTLTEHDDKAGDAVQMLLNETPWDAPVTETPKLHTVEIWEFLNLTDDIHPIHLHLVRFQLLNRQNFRVGEFQRSRRVMPMSDPVEPSPSEAGWKDTIQVYPGTVTRIIVPFEGYPGRYLWHCHILEHESNDMMRPYELLPAAEKSQV